MEKYHGIGYVWLFVVFMLKFIQSLYQKFLVKNYCCFS